ncbi:hypothetical protein SS1G_06012 [Sclerotinia sclerotiorum 1980 UF-70]|uniref:RING-type domain-containing protein n=2 Tax=Sclerotinia sclerotiorum (strain ATCC 18683 / 1980 / Ss-1) TaxID=665079 RepID=A7EL15_SCLS1|nr:hypothetical protein SS1G_06012 [Sclerotinia sclerotiorum 1980 UF-70]APA09783.1 hypothetical protein sscle_05g045530 [Sclerotinia sclerotiorum 1980 UF-70]EDO03531.1 hypothetical protein SS1G_06012 [Sclerotinia sclerotiorum 1980 UF-70]
MAVVNGIVEVLKVVGRQATIDPSSTAATSSSMSTATPTPSPSPTSTSNSNSPTSSPLLFFVALGFGVVFTNLWIIVGVKYCFRYNARNRALRAGEADPINLENMPVRPHRRRREKKLMSMDEVNERFPLIKYKNWVANRASEGLPTSGGVTAPPSRAVSVLEVEGVEPSSPVGSKHSVNTRPATATSNKEEGMASSPTHTIEGGHDDRKSMDAVISEKAAASKTEEHKEELHHLEEVPTRASTVDNKNPATVEEEVEDDDDDDDHIHTAVPPELLNNPGDSCAICIDTLEEDDDVRGLTCGHAFHAGCLDPWLTSRRACCPLCKADYFTPKPRPEGEQEPERQSRRANASRANMPQQPQSAWTGIRGMPGRFGASARSNVDTQNRDERQARRARQAQGDGPMNVAGGAGAPEVNTAPAASRWRPRIPAAFTGIRMPGSNRATGNASGQPNNSEPSPSQLEAGHRFA